MYENGVEGVSGIANFINVYEESQLNRDSHFLICGVFFVSKGNIFYVYLRSEVEASVPLSLILSEIDVKYSFNFEAISSVNIHRRKRLFVVLAF